MVNDDGFPPEVPKEVSRVKDLGHEIIIETGRAVANGVRVVKDPGIGRVSGVSTQARPRSISARFLETGEQA